MSLLWPNRLEVLLSAQGAAVIGSPAATSLDALLSAMKVKPNTHLSVVLSSDFVRYQLLPAQQVSMNTAEKLAYAAAAYKEIYGVEADGWKLKLHDTGFKQTSIVAAVEENFLEKLQQISQQHQIKLASVQPYLMGAYNSCRNQFSQFNGYFAIVDNAKILLLTMQLGQCKNLRMAAIGNDWQQDLKQLLARESMLNDESTNAVLLHVQTLKNMINIEGWQVSRVGAMHKQTASDSHLGMLGTPI